MKKTDYPLNNKRILLQYSVLFCMFAAGIFFVLLITQRSFMQFQDSYTQGVFRLLELRNQATNILNGKGFSLWSWYEGSGMDESLEIFVEIGSLAGSVFPAKYVELGFTVAVLVRMYLGGVAFILLGKEAGLNRRQNLIGALLYVFSACFIGMAIRQSEMLANAYLFPLLVWAAERIYKGKSPIPFILVVAYYMAAEVYGAYMSAIVIMIYIIVRYWHYYEVFDIKSYSKIIGGFILYGTIGIFLSAAVSLVSVSIIKNASSGSSLDSFGVLFDKHQYAVFGKMLLGSAATYDYLDIGIPIAIIMLLPIAVSRCTKKSSNVIMFVLLFVMMMIPFFSSMLNGFGYVTFRWSYTLLLFAVWSGAEQFDTRLLKEKKNLILALIALVVIGVWAVVPNLVGETSIGISGKFFWFVQLMSGFAILLIYKLIEKKDISGRTVTIAVLAVSLVSLSLGWSAGFYGNRDNFAKTGTVLKNLETSTFRASKQIEDKGFYRVDSVDGINRHAELRFPANENIWWKTNNLFIYNSTIPKSLTDFNVQLGNSYGYARRVYMLSNGNRMGLDFLYGVRYFLGNDTKKEGYEKSDNYAGYGFEQAGKIDGVNVFKNKYDVGLGFLYKRAVLESDFSKLDSLYKEQAMMQAAVIPDEQAEQLEKIELVKSDNLEFDIKDIPFVIADKDGLMVQNGEITAEKENATMTIEAENIPDCQLVVSFDNLRRNAWDNGSGSSYEIYASDGKVKKEAIALKSRQGVENLVNHDLNMGHHNGKTKIKICFERTGTYTFDGFHLYAMSTALYDKHASELVDEAFNIVDYDSKTVRGSVESNEGGILFLSIPVHENWSVYIDEKREAPIDNVNITFTGVYVPPGRHEIKLVYNNRYAKTGSLFTLLSLAAISIIFIKDRKAKNRQSNA